MSIPHYKYVLVGAGGAGSAAAAAIRSIDPVGSVLMIAQENSRPYLRPALNKEYLSRQKNRLDLVLEAVGWYDQQHIDLRTSRRVAHLDTSRKTTVLDNGDEIAFDKLLIATGASPKLLRLPGADLPNVFYLRTIHDCDRLHHAIDKAQSQGRSQLSPAPSAAATRGHALVIGAGLLALETAATLRQMNLRVDLVLDQQLPWAKFAGENTGKFLVRYLEQHDIHVHAEQSPERIEGDGRVQRVVLSDGQTIDGDFVLAAAGIIPNRDLVRNTAIAAEKAILVDDHCRTNVEGVYAAGDCAAIFDPLFGKHRLLDHWESARYTGTLAGTNMAGGELRYETVNTFSSGFFDLKMKAWGEPRLVDHRLLRGVPGAEPPDFAEIGIAADGRVAQVLALGRTAEHEEYCQLVQRRFLVNGQEEFFKDPTRDLGEILR